MDPVKIVEIKEDIISRNNEAAKDVRERLRKERVFYVNVMSSPGSGKTTLLIPLVNLLKKEFSVGVIEADIDSAEDAEKISEECGVRVIQMHTGNACHITCQMSGEALDALGTDGLDLVFLENIGNLVCPAEFDTGADENLVLLSVPEGDDKPIKYPLMFETATAVVITKADASPAFDFSAERARENVKKRNESCPIFVTGKGDEAGVRELADYISQKTREKIS